MAPLRERISFTIATVGALCLTFYVAYYWDHWGFPSRQQGISMSENGLANGLSDGVGTPMPLTKIPGNAHSSGFTVFDNLYLRNGTFYVVTQEPASFPDRMELISRPLDLGKDFNPNPTDEELQFIDPVNAASLLGESPIRKGGISVVIYDTSQFLGHFYHLWGEILLGFWRVYSTLASPSEGSLPAPRHFIYPFVESLNWRDRANLNGPLLRAAFPDASVSTADYWQDLITLNRTVLFERVALINRAAAHRHKLGGVWNKMIAGTMSLDVPARFFEYLRTTTIQNVLGYLPVLNSKGLVTSPAKSSTKRPVVTYISRQGTGRCLIEEDHNLLVKALQDLENEGLCEIQVPQMEHFTLAKQVELAARTTIMIGVHGNGLTHQLWMPPGPSSTVIEIFFPTGYAFDYAILAHNLGHKHYGVWNDTYVTTHQDVHHPKGMHENQIPVWAPTVIDLVRERLSVS